ncbi:MAG: copper-binding protein [Campylobacteraceae bacterium]|jgi:Cu(I)/Ag(I) efflux system protein CusF|nr:copper-binding protein [Campylobacteraceae bacterium]
MKKGFKAVLAAILLSFFPLSAQYSHHEVKTQLPQEIFSKGIIEAIDLTNKKVTITYESIEALSWPAMTMRFTFEDEELVKNLKVKDSVEFGFIQQGRVSFLKSIKPI